MYFVGLHCTIVGS